MRVAVVASAQIFGGFQNLPPPQSLDFSAFFGLSHLFPPRLSISVIFDTDLVTSQRVTTINYDRKVIRAALGKLNQRADETSAKIDLCLVTSKVDYAPPFDVNASFAEAFEIYTENAGA